MLECLRVGIDIGGTFTDFVVMSPKRQVLGSFKLLSTPENPALAVLEGMRRIRQDFAPQAGTLPLEVIHGSTVATNALLERKGAACALVATRGFKDLLEIGRQNRPALYDLFFEPPPQLAPAAARFEVDERVGADGQVLQPLDVSCLERLACQLGEAGVESVAVCFLFSFLHPEHEALAAETLRKAGFFVSVSSEILPEFREVERASTTVVNAYVSPALDRYLTYLESGLVELVPGERPARMRVMQSNGGSLSLAAARRFGVHCILSGPAGGVIGSQRVAQGRPSPVDVIPFDMGGTSTDVSLIAGTPRLTREAVIGGCPIAIPLLDIHTIGAGGGSIARVDSGGALRVGPESAGADPGPACYGRSGARRLQPTVTDANLFLGRLLPQHFLGGEMPLYPELAREAIVQLAQALNMDPLEAALGVIAVANANMERALRLISVERGHDPRRFSLLSFGGAGGLHAADLARRMGIPQVIIPPLASTLSAFGMLAADTLRDFSQTVMLSAETPPEVVQDHFTELERRARQALTQEGAALEEGSGQAPWRFEQTLDMRLRGQSYELTVPYTPNSLADFHTAHAAAYGFSRPEAAVEIVTLRLRALLATPPPLLLPILQGDCDPSLALIQHAPVAFSGALTWWNIPVYRGETLRYGNRIVGPALVVRRDTSILLEHGDVGTLDEVGNLLLAIAAPGAQQREG